MRSIALLLLVLVLPLAAGCGSEDSSDENGATAAQATEASTGESAGSTIKVDAMEFMFMPADLQAQPGSVTIELSNGGQFPHAIEIEGNGVEEESDTVDPGGSTSLTVDLEAGTYEIYCPVDDHKGKGMVGTLTVGSGGGAAGTTTDDNGGETETGEDDGGGTSGSDDDSGGYGP